MVVRVFQVSGRQLQDEPGELLIKFTSVLSFSYTGKLVARFSQRFGGFVENVSSSFARSLPFGLVLKEADQNVA